MKVFLLTEQALPSLEGFWYLVVQDFVSLNLMLDNFEVPLEKR
jgi:hypothetical protein